MIAEAIDTAYTIGWALLGWIAVGAFVATVGLFTTLLAVAQGWKAARRVLCGPCGASDTPDAAPDPQEAPDAPSARSAPSWARTEHDHQEAA